MADFATRSLGIGYPDGSLILAACVAASLATWAWTLGSVSVDTVAEPRAEAFYWLTITFSQTLGTALGDWTADIDGVGYSGAALIFGGALALVAGLYFWTRVSRVALFWARLRADPDRWARRSATSSTSRWRAGGLAFSRPLASAVLAGAILLLVLVLPQRAGAHPKAG